MAIRQAERLDSCHTLILADRSSVTTIQRAALLALQSGRPWQVLERLQAANAQEMAALETRIRQDMQEQCYGEESNASATMDEAEWERQVSIAMMETLKEDGAFRDRLFAKLEDQVPEFTRAFLKERDYLMAEAIYQQAVVASSSQKTTTNVVGVVGLAHVPGMQAHLKARIQGQAVPMEQESSVGG